MNHIQLGKRGEQIAIKYLQQLGYGILDFNWRPKRTEIDIIACDGSEIVFVEVKTRKSMKHGAPEVQVDRSKRLKYYSAADDFLYLIGHDDEIRFDVIAITFHPVFELTHFKDAFFPNWYS